MRGYAFPGGFTSVDYPAFLSRHDVVYQAPVVDAFDGLPVGNGDLGALVWTPPDRLRLQVNKVDLIDDGPDEPLQSWADDWDEVSTMLRHAATLSIGNSLRTYDRVYLTDFEARLRLADARVDLRAATPFASASLEAFASDAGVLVLRYRDTTEEPVARTIALERWGTRSFIHWYRKIRRDVPLSLLATETETARNTARAFGEDAHAFNLAGVAEARLGLGADLVARLAAWPSAFQLYPRGFTHYFISSHPDMELDHRCLKKVQVACSPGEETYWPIAISNHMSLEAGPMLELCVNEMLLQSHTGTIRVFPAVPPDWRGEFRLHAVGGFVVSARRAAGRTSHVVVESRGGEECHLVDPWPGERLIVFRHEGGWRRAVDGAGELVGFPTEADGVYLLLPEGVEPSELERRQVGGAPNRAPKWSGRAVLGTPRGF
jgi:hypothetical protein